MPPRGIGPASGTRRGRTYAAWRHGSRDPASYRDRVTRLCVPILVGDLDRARHDVAAAVEAGADVVELRIDYLTDPAEVRAVTDGFDVPFILTCRPVWEGGHSELPDADRRELLTAAAEGTDWLIDYEGKAEGTVPNRILSRHDFRTRPTTLTRQYADDCATAAEVVKVAWAARSVRDNVEAFELLRQRPKPTVALCMGEAGLPSRVLAKKFGAYLTFAALRDDRNTAAGQPTIRDLNTLYRWDRLTARTKVYGVVGDPVAHSISPHVHNAVFDALGYDGVYLPLPVEGSYASFKAFMETWRAFGPLDLSGLSVTIPHKAHALRYLDEVGGTVEPLARRIGAVNTITLDGDAIRGRNTDHAAILSTVTDVAGAVAGRPVAVLGAGGTGRTAVAALADAGAIVTVYNRTRARADALAAEFGASAGDWGVWEPADAWLNTTSLGMHPDTDAGPFDDRVPPLTPETLVWDAVYTPRRTKLLRQAADAGARTAGGLEMFVRQAAAQSEAWTGRPAPLDAIRAAAEARLGP